MKRRQSLIIVALVLLASIILAACGSAAPATDTGAGASAAAPEAGASQAAAAPATGDGVTIRYGLWDSAQMPAYQACADAFTKANPGITIKIEQLGWDDYWSNLQTGMVGGTAPDVFTNHLAKYPEFASKGQLVDIEPLVKQDGVDTSVYIGELADLWTREGKRYGLPKDWDTIALVYNKDMLEKAGVDEASLKELTWNAQDGGSFGELIKKLTLDANGNNATSPDFDKSNVTQYGFIPDGSGGAYGQTQWSGFAVSNGFKFIDEPWGTELHYDDPKLAEAVQWWADQSLNGVAPPLSDITSLGASTLFTTAKGATTLNGSWTIGQFLKDSSFPVAFAPMPEGPGGRKSMFNGLADSIFAGTKNPNEAWQWVKFAASKECADIVGSFGVVFPAQQSGVDAAIAKYKESDVDVSAFTDIALEPDATFLFPIHDYASEVSATMTPVMDSIMLGEVKAADALKTANEEVNANFQ